MKRILSILPSLAFATCVMADNITVGTTQDLVNAAATVKPGDTILLTDGTYRDLRLTVTADGTGDKMITIKAQNPGKAYISGNSQDDNHKSPEPGQSIYLRQFCHRTTWRFHPSVRTVFQRRQQKPERMENPWSGYRQHICRPLRNIRLPVLRFR